MKILMKPFVENMKAIGSVVADFIYIDCTDEKNCAMYVSTDIQAMKVPLEVSDVGDDEKNVYVVNKAEFVHLVPYMKESMTLHFDYSYVSEDGTIKGKFESNEGYADELESRKMLFDHEDDYKPFMEVTPSIMEGISKGSIFVSPDSIKSAERYLDIQKSKVFSYSKIKLYINDIDVSEDGLLSSEVIKSIQSLGVGTVVKKNEESLLITNAQRSIFIYQSVPNDVDYHPVLDEKFQEKIANVKTFNKVSLNIDELRNKLDYISFYSSRNPNNMCYLKEENGKIFLSTDENTSIELSSASIEKTEEFERMSVPFDCMALLTVVSKIGKDCENLSIFVSAKEENKLVLVKFGDSEEIVLIAKLNV